jgi:hypothetical protein
MARTIGVKYKNQLKRIVEGCFAKDMNSLFAIWEEVKRLMPQEAFDTWESAYNEMERLTGDLVMNRNYEKRHI